MKSTISKSLKDILSMDVILFVIKIAIASLALSSIVVWLFWDGVKSMVGSYISWIPWEWLQTTGAGMVSILMIYILFIIIVSLLTSLTSEKLLIKIAKKHYPNVKVVGSPSISRSIMLTLKTSILFLLLFVLFIPLLFIPIFGQIVMLYLWSILIKQPTIHDVSSLFMFDKKHYKKKSKRATIIAMTASLFNYIPVLNIFTPVFAQIMFLHHIFTATPANSH